MPLLCPGHPVLYLHNSSSQPWLHSRIIGEIFKNTNAQTPLPERLTQLVQVWPGHGEVAQTSQVMLIHSHHILYNNPLIGPNLQMREQRPREVK